MRALADYSDAELASISATFEAAPATKIIEWAVDSFAPHLALAASMTDALLIDLAVKVDPAIEVVFIDTRYHFAETLETVEAVRLRYGLNLRVMTAEAPEVELWRVDPENCCSHLKVGELDRALLGKKAWMGGLRRADAPSREAAPIVSRDRRGLVKLNPIANWSDDDVAQYIDRHQVPVNPLLLQGYPSIGCEPCTQPVTPGESARAGRWVGLDRTECGLHV